MHKLLIWDLLVHPPILNSKFYIKLYYIKFNSIILYYIKFKICIKLYYIKLNNIYIILNSKNILNYIMLDRQKGKLDFLNHIPTKGI